MGAALAVLALREPGLSGNAARVLVRMALTAQDRDPEPVYWAGWAFLATEGLGRQAYDKGAKQAVAKALRELTERGLVKVRRPGGNGMQAEYVLCITLG